MLGITSRFKGTASGSERNARAVLGALAAAALAVPVLAQPSPIESLAIAPQRAAPERPAFLSAPDTGPWRARYRRGVRVANELPPGARPAVAREPSALSSRRLRSLGLRGGPRTHIPIALWPLEPSSPPAEPARFTRALAALCPDGTPAPAIERIAGAVLAAAHAFEVDPFLLSALVHHQSACDSRAQDSYGIGLTRINVGMHAAHVRLGAYHYQRPLPAGGFVPATLSLHGHALTPSTVQQPETNVFLAAAFLRVFDEQCPAIDDAFHSAPHRHPVSHLIYGDSVRSALPEAQILTARRRMLEYYLRSPDVCEQSAAGIRSPLDGAPRIVIGVMGDPRDGGARLHAGIDLMASEGERVRAVADGTVISAGVDLREQGLVDMPSERAGRVPLGRMGPRGLFVRVAHRDGVVSLYAHLASYRVQVGEHVVRGQAIGRVGLTGVHASSAHLHIGLFRGEQAIDPLLWLDPHVITVDRGVDLGALDAPARPKGRALP